MTKVKICGLREIEHALVAAEAGAELLGMVFARSARQISPERAKEIVLAVRSLKHPPLTAGVFVNAMAHDVNHIARNSGLDLVQLSGDESWEYCLDIEKPVIKVIHVPSYKSAGEILAYLEHGQRVLGEKGFGYLLDSGGKGAYGGTGQIFDWGMAGELSHSFRIIIAGGLTPENVGEAIRASQPWGVDVSSGVETEDRKDSFKIRAFVAAVRKIDQCFGDLGSIRNQ